jgi:hypothetical protein
MVKPPKFAGPMSWALFHQFCAMVDHDSWAAREKAKHLLAILQGWTADILQCPIWSDIWGYCQGTKGPLRSPAGGGLPVIIQSQDPTEWQVTTRISSSSWAVDPLCPCWVIWELHTEGGTLCVC